ncbi:glycosyltransferase [Serinicoccus sp. LYQ131]|uniref:glycosyltransferase n=1 Tax=Serinicoccus sp. LYQ131 TaxID=3378797 RepID=UPI003851D105
MRIVILAGGSRGDYQPIIPVARELERRGHQVAVSASTDFVPWLTSQGVTVEEVEVDAMAIYRAGDVSAAMAGTGVPGQLTALQRQAEAMAPELARAIVGLWPRYDAVVATALTLGMVLQMDAADPRPHVLMLFVPALPSRWGDASMFAVRPGRSWRNLVAGLRSLRPAAAVTTPVVSALVGLGVPRPGPVRALRSAVALPTFVAHTAEVITERRVSGRRVRTTGYPFLESPPGTELDRGLEDFLAAGPPPVYAGFGSQSLDVTRAALRHTVDGALAAGHRVVALRGTGLAEEDDERVHFLDQAPHDLLFPRMAAVAHHGGAGTTAQALRAGVPQVVVPFALDQPFFARRVHEIGVAAAPVPVAEASAARLRAAFEEVADPAVVQRAATVGARVRAERGPQRAADRIEAALSPGG